MATSKRDFSLMIRAGTPARDREVKELFLVASELAR